MYADNANYLEEKRKRVLAEIKPICEAFKIKDYDYIISQTGQREMLRIYDTKIGCSCNSLSAIKHEMIGWIIVEIYCRERNIGYFQTQTLNRIKQHWLEEEN